MRRCSVVQRTAYAETKRKRRLGERIVDQYRINKIKYAVSIMAVTLATENIKASRASL
jgi:hypothetical protein